MSQKIVFTSSTEGVEMQQKKKGQNFRGLEWTRDAEFRMYLGSLATA